MAIMKVLPGHEQKVFVDDAEWLAQRAQEPDNSLTFLQSRLNSDADSEKIVLMRDNGFAGAEVKMAAINNKLVRGQALTPAETQYQAQFLALQARCDKIDTIRSQLLTRSETDPAGVRALLKPENRATTWKT